MLKAIGIENFKSARKLDLSFGRVNIFIGANGTGKSTILEALAFAVASENNKLNTELLEIRGIRITEPQLMRSGFEKVNKDPISIKLFLGEKNTIARHYKVDNSNEEFSNWEIVKDTVIKNDDDSLEGKVVEDQYLSINMFKDLKNTILNITELLNSDGMNKLFEDDKETLKKHIKELMETQKGKEIKEINKYIVNVENDIENGIKSLIDFAIYSPEYRELRTPYKEGALKPLGVNGEGLFKLYRNICVEQPEDKEDIEDGLALIDWFDSLEELSELEDDLVINDRFIPYKINQRSTNEGFLYILFYMCLIVSQKTPKIFAIDNIDTALNPGLCRELVKLICKMSKKYDKQIFLTAHNPAVLDGLNLNNDDERLFVVSRERKSGATKVKRIDINNKPTVKVEHKKGEVLPLSEAMLRGYIPNALPKGF